MSLVYLAHTVGQFTDHFAWQKAPHCLLLFLFVMRWGPQISHQCTAVNKRFLTIILTGGTENGFHQLADIHHI